MKELNFDSDNYNAIEDVTQDDIIYCEYSNEDIKDDCEYGYSFFDASLVLRITGGVA